MTSSTLLLLPFQCSYHKPMTTFLPSRTSIMVAAGRALGARIPDPAMRNPDLLAEKLVGPEEIDLIKEHPLGAALTDFSGATPTNEASATANMMLIRTKFIDEKLERAIQDGATQYVILGAGFDTRAHRFAELLKHVRVFEVDSTATQQRKRQRVDAALGGAPANLTYVTIDFNRDNLGDVLRQAGYDPSRKTFFTWEGVSMYVAEEGVRETLRTFGTQSAPGSSLVMDYTTKTSLEFLAKFPDLGSGRFLAAWGEPWVFGVPDGAEKEFFTSVGLEAREFFPVVGPEAIKRYLTKPDGTILGAPPPGTPRPELLPEMKAAIAELGIKPSASFYTLVELVAPEPASAE
jgi:methyltransferase (TIGR00027 family)